jgi:putative ABC transport system permease protein
MRKLLRNLHFGARGLLRSPGLTFTVLLTLALGIGATTAIFTIDYASLIADTPFPHSEQLVVVWSKVNDHGNSVSAGDYLDWSRQNSTFQHLNAVAEGQFNISSKEQPISVEGASYTPGYFTMLGTPFTMGRDFLPEEGQPGKDQVVILTHKLWQKLGADPHIIGTTMSIDGAPRTVIGITAPGQADRAPAQVCVPLVFKPEQINHNFHWLLVMGRLKPGVTIKQAQADMDSVTAHIAQAYPKSNHGWGARVDPEKLEWMPKETQLILWLLLGAVGFVLLIACANVANLLLGRSMSRQKEMAIRSSLGATPAMIFEQLLTENLLLAFLGGALGIALGYALLQGVLALMPHNTLPTEADLRINLPILAVAIAVTTLTGLLFGCVPAWYASRIDPAESLKEGGRSGTGSGRHRLRKALVVSEFALALTLLAGAGLAIHSFRNLLNVDLGLRTDHVLTFYLQAPDSRSKEPDQIISYYRRMIAAIQAVPGVSHVAVGTGRPLEGVGFGMPFVIAGKSAVVDPSQRPITGFGLVTPEYFQTYGIRLDKGRFLNDQDTGSSVKVAVINEELARKYLGGSNPLQQRLLVEQLIPGVTKLGPPVEWQIVGVFHNVRDFGLRQDFPEVLVPFWQVPWPSTGIGVRTAEDPASMAKSIAAAVHSVDPQIALSDTKTRDEVRDQGLSSERFSMMLFAAFAGVALLLAAVGIYGVMSFSVTQRAHEIALRMALGATRGRVVGLVIKEGVILASTGLALGLAGAYFVERTMQSMLFGIGRFDLSAFAAVGLILLTTALLACYLPARRAASQEPMAVLRSE